MSADESSRDRQSDLAVMDANELKQKRRLKRLLDVREKVEAKADEAEELYVLGDISAPARNLMVLRAVREYIRETWTLLMEHYEGPEGQDGCGCPGDCEYLLGRELGTLELPHEGASIQYRGLASLLQCDDQVVEQWTETREFRHGPNQTVEQSEVHVVPLDVSWSAYLLLNEFLADAHDLEIRFEELDDGLPTWGFEEVKDYDPEDDPSLQNGTGVANGD